MKPQLMPGMPAPAYVDRLRNVHSQYGEDGLIEWLLQQLPGCPRYFVEFGGWDGLHLSNCARLAEIGWDGCFIEGDAQRAQEAVRNYADRPGVHVMSAWVGSEGENSLASLLRRAGSPREFGVLSIDIDGNDFHVWRGLTDFSPAIVVIEFNPTIPAQVDFVQPCDPAVHQGCSLTALYRLALDKGYILAAATELNGVFVRADLAQAAGIAALSPAQVKSTTFETHAFHGYDGSVHVSGYGQLVWHGVPIRGSDWQVLPPDLRKFPVGQGDAYFNALQTWKASR